MKGATTVLILALCWAAVTAQPFGPGQGLLPTGNLLTTDAGGPYNLSLLSQQANEIKAALAARKDYTDADLIDFTVNVECLEGLFDTWGTFGFGFVNNLTLGGPTPLGARRANLTQAVLPFMQEVALNEQGHALFTRQAGSSLPCPPIDFDGGFNELMAYAYDLPDGLSIEEVFGAPFDPFKNDQNYVLSVLSLEELGATGNKGLALLYSNPVLANGHAGLATSATAQATVERMLLWGMRNMTVDPFNETVSEVFARVSAARDKLDGTPISDQGLTNTDPKFLSIPNTHINMIPTDVRGLTLSRTPQQVIRIVTVGSDDGIGGFFPEGLLGRIGMAGSVGYNETLPGTAPFPARPSVGTQMTAAQIGVIPGPIVPTSPVATPTNVTGELSLTQDLNGQLDNGTYLTRGFMIPPNGVPNTANTSQVQVAINQGRTQPAPGTAITVSG